MRLLSDLFSFFSPDEDNDDDDDDDDDGDGDDDDSDDDDDDDETLEASMLLLYILLPLCNLVMFTVSTLLRNIWSIFVPNTPRPRMIQK